jgi:tetratricopeptide (TPR) repeat protein
MKKLLSLFALLIFSHLSAQDYGNKSDALELCTEMQTDNFSSNIDAENALEKILNAIGASKRFVLQPCNNINNAVAISYKGIRYILYDKNFMNSINNGSNWGNLFILAHEVGHHINGHSLDLILYSSKSIESKTLVQRRKQELEADEFAGFIIAKLGGNIIEINKLIKEISTNNDDSYSTHPNITKRLNAIQIGYNKALNKKSVFYEKKSNLNTAEEYYYKAYNYYKIGEYQESILYYDQAIALNPNNDYYYNNRGVSKYKLEDHIGAIEDYNKAIDINPNDGLFHFNKGNSKNILGDLRGSLLDYSKAIELNSNDYSSYICRAITKRKLKDYRGSLIDNSKAIEINPNNSEGYVGRGIGKFKLKYFQEATADFNRAIELNPNDSLSFYYRGMSKFNLNLKESACLDWSKAGELGDAEAYDLIKEYCN